ncbi:MAG: hypothetical protein HC794_01800 [Nitrospiraceae bacterium]|nr:hypothetical protein [Nitrospiraceae bacterium]
MMGISRRWIILDGERTEVMTDPGAVDEALRKAARLIEDMKTILCETRPGEEILIDDAQAWLEEWGKA